MPTTPEVRTAAEIAARWRCSPRTVRRLIADGHLPAMRISPGVFRVLLADVEAYETAAKKEAA